MPRPFLLVDRVETPEGPLELRKRGETDFMITIGKRVLMSSIIHRSEVAVAELGCAPIAQRKAPRVLIGGLGLGYTLRAALDALPRDATVVVAELNEKVVEWCQGPLAVLTNGSVHDARVHVAEGDVAERIREVALDRARPRFDSIILDLYVGPSDEDTHANPLYGRKILKHTYDALSAGGVYSVWGENVHLSFEARLRATGFAVKRVRTQGGGPRHAVYVATKTAAPRADR